MASETYSTGQVAAAVGIHVNTVRFYEQIGFISAPPRRANGYRAYSGLHIAQCRFVRLAMRAEVLQSGLRAKAVEIVRLCAAGRWDDAAAATGEYRAMIDRETQSALAAAESVERLRRREPSVGQSPLRRAEAAAVLDVTAETLRTWERSGLVRIKRCENGYRVYSAADMERLNIIRTLRCAGYSLSAILRLLDRMDAEAVQSVEQILNTPGVNEDIISACDRLVISLRATGEDAEQMADMLALMREKYSTIQ